MVCGSGGGMWVMMGDVVVGDGCCWCGDGSVMMGGVWCCKLVCMVC